MSKKQKLVTWSSCESEYITQVMYIMQGQWAAQVFQDLGILEYIRKNKTTVDIHRDNQGALTLVKNPYLYERSKHIDVYYYYICDLAEKKKLEIEYIPIAEMPANRLTKPLAWIMFGRFRGQLSVTTNWRNMWKKEGIIQEKRATRPIGEY